MTARVFRTTPHFRKALRKLSPEQKRAAKAAFQIFKENPFDPRLGAHKIQRLSGILRRTVYAVVIEGDLRAVFHLEGDTVSYQPSSAVASRAP